jgi:hypothetical protein
MGGSAVPGTCRETFYDITGLNISSTLFLSFSRPSLSFHVASVVVVYAISVFSHHFYPSDATVTEPRHFRTSLASFPFTLFPCFSRVISVSRHFLECLQGPSSVFSPVAWKD